jgi:multidrug efflux pump subunit AcrB
MEIPVQCVVQPGLQPALGGYAILADLVLRRSASFLLLLGLGFAASLLLFPLLELAFFSRTDAGQFPINVKAPSGTRLVEGSESYAPLARALIGGLSVSVLFIVFLAPAGFRPAYARREVSAGPINEEKEEPIPCDYITLG